MAQNIYDTTSFFEAYSALCRSVEGLTLFGAPEWPVLSSYLPPLKGASFLDLGCGFGWYSRYAQSQGASHIRGIDISSQMLARAKEMSPDPGITYQQADLETMEFKSDFYDVVFSSLALHYLLNLKGLFSQIFQTLKPGGTLIFSVEHPIALAPSNAAWIKDSEGKYVWPLDRYLDEGPRNQEWLGDKVVKQHRTVGRYVKMLVEEGFELKELEEWGPTLEQLEQGLGWNKARERPVYLLIKAIKPGK
jgi:SAM-dependent methyltransferase